MGMDPRHAIVEQSGRSKPTLRVPTVCTSVDACCDVDVWGAVQRMAYRMVIRIAPTVATAAMVQGIQMGALASDSTTGPPPE